ncbi:MAG: ATP-binding protein [Microbacterium hominis]|jgi:hypothetical protein|nr:ATP-binding protein [Microbacterium hominis]
MSPLERRNTVRLVRSYFCDTPSYDHLSAQFDYALDLLGWAPKLAGNVEDVDLKDRAGIDLSQLEHDGFREDQFDPEARYSEGRILVVTGETGTGKSRALMKLLRDNSNRIGDRLISTVAPSPCTLLQLGRELLCELGYELRGDKKEYLVWEDVRRKIDEKKIRIVYVDEMQHLPQRANRDQRENILNTIKHLTRRRPDPLLIIASGTHEIADFLQIDGQVRRRCIYVEISRLALPLDILPVACSIGELARLGRLQINNDVADNVAARLIHASNYAFGTAMELTTEAINHALGLEQADLHIRNFGEAFRRRTFCSNYNNPFHVDNWKEIDPTRVIDRTPIADRSSAMAGKGKQ